MTDRVKEKLSVDEWSSNEPRFGRSCPRFWTATTNVQNQGSMDHASVLLKCAAECVSKLKLMETRRVFVMTSESYFGVMNSVQRPGELLFSDNVKNHLLFPPQEMDEGDLVFVLLSSCVTALFDNFSSEDVAGTTPQSELPLGREFSWGSSTEGSPFMCAIFQPVQLEAETEHQIVGLRQVLLFDPKGITPRAEAAQRDLQRRLGSDDDVVVTLNRKNTLYEFFTWVHAWEYGSPKVASEFGFCHAMSETEVPPVAGGGGEEAERNSSAPSTAPAPVHPAATLQEAKTPAVVLPLASGTPGGPTSGMRWSRSQNDTSSLLLSVYLHLACGREEYWREFCNSEAQRGVDVRCRDFASHHTALADSVRPKWLRARPLLLFSPELLLLSQKPATEYFGDVYVKTLLRLAYGKPGPGFEDPVHQERFVEKFLHFFLQEQRNSSYSYSSPLAAQLATRALQPNQFETAGRKADVEVLAETATFTADDANTAARLEEELRAVRQEKKDLEEKHRADQDSLKKLREHIKKMHNKNKNRLVATRQEEEQEQQLSRCVHVQNATGSIKMDSKVCRICSAHVPRDLQKIHQQDPWHATQIGELNTAHREYKKKVSTEPSPAWHVPGKRVKVAPVTPFCGTCGMPVPEMMFYAHKQVCHKDSYFALTGFVFDPLASKKEEKNLVTKPQTPGKTRPYERPPLLNDWEYAHHLPAKMAADAFERRYQKESGDPSSVEERKKMTFPREKADKEEECCVM